MKRRLFNILSALSLLLCVALGVLWPRSYRVADAIGYSDHDTAEALTTADGFLLLWVWHTDDPKIMQAIWATRGLHYEATTPGFSKARRLPHGSVATGLEPGFLFPEVILRWEDLSSLHPGAGEYWYARVPLWMVVTATALLPLLWIASYLPRRRRWRLRHGLCLHCGYDLRASKERCPECGTAIASPEGASA